MRQAAIIVGAVAWRVLLLGPQLLKRQAVLFWRKLAILQLARQLLALRQQLLLGEYVSHASPFMLGLAELGADAIAIAMHARQFFYRVLGYQMLILAAARLLTARWPLASLPAMHAQIPGRRTRPRSPCRHVHCC